MMVLPTPLTETDRDAGYWWQLSMRQVEVFRTLVFDAPRRARSFAETLVRDNLGLGRPDQVELIFHGRQFRPGRKPKDPPTYKTRVVTRGVDVTVNLAYKHSRIKQYLKEGRAWRIESVINSPDDIGVQRSLSTSSPSFEPVVGAAVRGPLPSTWGSIGRMVGLSGE